MYVGGRRRGGGGRLLATREVFNGQKRPVMLQGNVVLHEDAMKLSV